MSRSKQKVQNNFEPETRKTERSRAMVKALLIASAIEAPLLFLTVWFMPVSVQDASGQTHVEYRTPATRAGAKIKFDLLTLEILAIGAIPASAVILTILKYR